ncbi:MAG: lysophospholipid acyltransferase family protein [Kordiimonas sp.]
MNKNLLYDNRFLSALLWGIGHLILKIGRWKVVGEVPAHNKYVCVVAPHTSNWDFPIFIGLVGALRIRGRYLGKHTLFESPLGWLFYYLGGIPVDRSSPNAADIVDQAVEAMEKDDRPLVLGIAPEGTRSGVSKWKTGFYRIAVAANLPIARAFLDTKTRQIGFGPTFYPTGDIKKDMAEIQAFFTDKQGIKPRNQIVD